MKKFQFSSILFGFLLISCFSCKQDGGDFEINYYAPEDYAMMTQSIDIPEFPLDYTNEFPKYYRGGTLGRFDKDQATLGRVLFYDKKLSNDATISCASCHKQEIAFSDDIDLSVGIQDRRTSRNSLALGAVFSFNEYYGTSSVGRVPFFWDNRASSVEEQSVQAFNNPNEMGMEMHQVVSTAKNLDYYVPLFEMAFGEDPSGNRTNIITEENILSAISVFVNSIGSFNSKYDQALDDSGFQLSGLGSNAPSGNLSSLTAAENAGKALYLNNCSSCHGSVNGVPGKLQANNGLDIVYEDNGTGDFTNQVGDMGKFKVPTLRNIMVTGPYMHDGRFETIEEVVEHYSSGIQAHTNLDPELRNGNSPRQMNFTSQEKQDLISFLNTFTDTGFLTDVKYSDPFKN